MDPERARAFDTDKIVFVHRSACEYLLGPECSVSWLKQNPDKEQLARKTLGGLNVYLRHAPFSINNGPPFTSGVSWLTREAIHVAKIAGIEMTKYFFEWLDNLHNDIPMLLRPPHAESLGYQALCDRLCDFWQTIAIKIDV